MYCPLSTRPPPPCIPRLVLVNANDFPVARHHLAFLYPIAPVHQVWCPCNAVNVAWGVSRSACMGVVSSDTLTVTHESCVLCVSCTQVRVRVRVQGRVLVQEPLVDIPDTLPMDWGVQAGLGWRSLGHRRRSSLTTSCSSPPGKVLPRSLVPGTWYLVPASPSPSACRRCLV